jgi:hypothetical protein
LGFRMTISEDRLRRAAIRVLTTVAALPSLYAAAPLPLAGTPPAERGYSRSADGHYADLVRPRRLSLSLCVCMCVLRLKYVRAGVRVRQVHKLYDRAPADTAADAPIAYGALRPLVLLLLLSGLGAETAADNAVALVNALTLWAAVDGPACPGLAGAVAGVLGDKARMQIHTHTHIHTYTIHTLAARARRTILTPA